MAELSLKQEIFCREYVKCCNATKAAITAGYSEATAMQQGSRLLINVEIKKRIQDLGRNLLDALDISAVQIAYEYKKIGFASVNDTHSDWTKLKDFNSLDADVKTTIAEIHTEKRTDKDGTSTETIKLKMHDKIKALEKLSRMVGVQEGEKYEVPGTGGAPTKHIIEFVDGSQPKLDISMLSLATLKELRAAYGPSIEDETDFTLKSLRENGVFGK